MIYPKREYISQYWFELKGFRFGCTLVQRIHSSSIIWVCMRKSWVLDYKVRLCNKCGSVGEGKFSWGALLLKPADVLWLPAHTSVIKSDNQTFVVASSSIVRRTELTSNCIKGNFPGFGDVYVDIHWSLVCPTGHTHSSDPPFCTPWSKNNVYLLFILSCRV